MPGYLTPELTEYIDKKINTLIKAVETTSRKVDSILQYLAGFNGDPGAIQDIKDLKTITGKNSKEIENIKKRIANRQSWIRYLIGPAATGVIIYLVQNVPNWLKH